MRAWSKSLVLLVCALAATSVQVLHAQSVQSYENKEVGIRLAYPADWTKTENFQGLLAAFRAPKEKANPELGENVSVLVMDLSQKEATLKKFTATQEKLLSKDPDVKVVKSKKTTLGGLPAHQVVCAGNRGGLKVKYLQIWTVKGNKAYMMTYGAMMDTYNNFIKEAEQIIASLKFV